MNARAIIENLDSMEGVPDFDLIFEPGTKEHREYNLRHRPPTNAREATARGVSWYIKDGRKINFSLLEPSHGGYPTKSHSIATGRNERRARMGYRDKFSTRERDWPSGGGRKAFYKRQDRAREERAARAEQTVLASLGIGI